MRAPTMPADSRGGSSAGYQRRDDSLSAAQAELATSPATQTGAREADATMARDGWAEDAHSPGVNGRNEAPVGGRQARWQFV